MVLEDLAFVIPGTIDGFELKVPFGRLHQDLGRNRTAHLPGDDVHPISGGLGLQQIVNPVQRGLRGVADLAGNDEGTAGTSSS